MNLAKTLTDIRIRQGLSQDEFAKRIFVSRDLVSKWEKGTRRPNWAMIEKIADVFSVSVDTIVDKKELIFNELSKCLPDDCTLTLNEIVLYLNSFLKEINAVEANIFLYRYYFLYSTSEIALIINQKENRIRSTLSRTRKKLQRYIKERCSI